MQQVEHEEADATGVIELGSEVLIEVRAAEPDPGAQLVELVRILRRQLDLTARRSESGWVAQYVPASVTDAHTRFSGVLLVLTSPIVNRAIRNGELVPVSDRARIRLPPPGPIREFVELVQAASSFVPMDHDLSSGLYTQTRAAVDGLEAQVEEIRRCLCIVCGERGGLEAATERSLQVVSEQLPQRGTPECDRYVIERTRVQLFYEGASPSTLYNRCRDAADPLPEADQERSAKNSPVRFRVSELDERFTRRERPRLPRS